jgi:hypothetical protein
MATLVEGFWSNDGVGIKGEVKGFPVMNGCWEAW